jgi:hypothetical protein
VNDPHLMVNSYQVSSVFIKDEKTNPKINIAFGEIYGALADLKTFARINFNNCVIKANNLKKRPTHYRPAVL